MAENLYYNKIIVNGEPVIDLTSDTITEEALAYGITAHDASGAIITGTSTKDSDTSDATASASEILATKTAYVRGSKLTGSMPNNGAVTGVITTKDEQYTIPQGYHDGSGKVGISAAEQSKLIATNIRKDITILGITGTMSGTEEITAQAKSATPNFTQQIITPDSGYDYLTQVTIAAIPVTEADNPAGGKTMTVG